MALFKSAADEIGHWAEQCRRWAVTARTREHRLTLQSLGRLLGKAAAKAETEADTQPQRRPPPKS